MADPEEVVSAFYAAYNGRDAAAIRALLADDFTRTTGNRVIEGADAYFADLQREWANRPDARVELRRITTTATGAAVEGSWHVTSRAPIELPDGTTLQPTGQSGALPFATIFEIADGLLVRDTSYYETMALWRSLGHTIRIE
jgi:steroid delta-isomerase-like uncharacterized protein